MNIYRAVRKGRNNLIKQKIKEGVDVNSSVKDGTTLLMFACKYNYIDTVKLLLELGADINRHKRTEYSYNPLMYACDKGYIEIMNLLLDNDANIEILDIYGRDLIRRNIDKPEVIKVLISYGIKLDYNFKGDAKTHITAAVWANLLPVFELLVEAGADVNQEDTKYEGYTAVHQVISRNSSPEFLRRLLECNADINHKDKYGNTVFHRVKRQDNNYEKLLNISIQYGYDINAINNQGETVPISLLSFWRYGETALVYLKNTLADVSIKDNNGRSLLEYAAECDNLQLFDFVYNSCKHNLENIAGALYNASACGRIENVKYLIDKRININAHFKNGHTALTYLANWGSTENHYEVVKLLLSNGADINIKNKKDGLSALELAKKYNGHKMYNLIKKFLV